MIKHLSIITIIRLIHDADEYYCKGGFFNQLFFTLNPTSLSASVSKSFEQLMIKGRCDKHPLQHIIDKLTSGGSISPSDHRVYLTQFLYRSYELGDMEHYDRDPEWSVARDVLVAHLKKLIADGELDKDGGRIFMSFEDLNYLHDKPVSQRNYYCKVYSLSPYDRELTLEQCDQIKREGKPILKAIRNSDTKTAQAMDALFIMASCYKEYRGCMDYTKSYKFSPFTKELMSFWNEHKGEFESQPEEAQVNARQPSLA